MLGSAPRRFARSRDDDDDDDDESPGPVGTGGKSRSLKKKLARGRFFAVLTAESRRSKVSLSLEIDPILLGHGGDRL